MIRVGYAAATAVGVVSGQEIVGQFIWRAKTGVAALIPEGGGTGYQLTGVTADLVHEVRKNEVEVTGRDGLGTLATWLVTRDPRRGCGCGAR